MAENTVKYTIKCHLCCVFVVRTKYSAGLRFSFLFLSQSFFLKLFFKSDFKETTEISNLKERIKDQTPPPQLWEDIYSR